MASLPSSQSSSKGVVELISGWIRKPLTWRLSSLPDPQPLPVQKSLALSPSILILPDGAKLAYEVLGLRHLGRATPIVLVCGMTSVRVDYERLTAGLVETRPVLLYDHRGMGDSTLTPAEDEEMTIELLARDLLALLSHLKWSEVAILGYSMGGVISQQLLLLPYHPLAPTALPFRVTHMLLAGTRSQVVQNAGLKITPPKGPRTPEETKAITRRVVGTLVDPSWVEENGSRFEALFQQAVNPTLKRPAVVVAKQGAALQKFYFSNLFVNLSEDTQVMLIHGYLDQVIPFSCAEEILRRIPHAKLVETGSLPGQVPSLNFGHLWYEYFDIHVWHDVVDKFIKTGSNLHATVMNS